MKRRDFVKTLATSFMAPGLLLSQHTLAADIAFGRHEAWEPINSVFANRDRGPAQTRAVLTAAAQQPAGENWILSTHRSNILLATGQNTSMGDVLLTRYDPKQPDQLRVLARLDWR